jgi:hypothetical protein
MRHSIAIEGNVMYSIEKAIAKYPESVCLLLSSENMEKLIDLCWAFNLDEPKPKRKDLKVPMIFGLHVYPVENIEDNIIIVAESFLDIILA